MEIFLTNYKECSVKRSKKLRPLVYLVVKGGDGGGGRYIPGGEMGGGGNDPTGGTGAGGKRIESSTAPTRPFNF